MNGCSALTSVNLTGIQKIAANAFASCTAIKNITIPTTVTFIDSGAFASCSALVGVTLEAESYTAGLMSATSFPDKDGLIIYCQNQDVVNEVNALGYTLTKAVYANVTAESGIKMVGFSIRTEDYNGLRGIFSFDNSVIATNKANGLALVEYGAILASEANKNAYGTELTYNGTDFETANSKIVKKAIWSGGSYVGNLLSSSTETLTKFAVSVVKYTGNYDTGVSMLGYSIWQDTAGNNYIKYVDCDNDAYDVTSIYDVTLGMYKNGVVNAEDDPDGVIWAVLEALAVTLAAGTDYRDGDRDIDGVAFGSEVKFANMPLYQAKSNGLVYEGSKTYATKYSIKKDTTYTLLPDGDDYVAVFRGSGALPAYNYYGAESYSALHHSFNSYNGSGGTKYTASLYDESGAYVGYEDSSGNFMLLNTQTLISDGSVHRRQPSPTLTKSTISKIKTVIIDEGITGISNYAFCNTELAHITTLIYASSVISVGSAAFMSHKTLVTASPKGVEPTENLMDLTGFTSLGSSCFNKAAQSEHMLLLPKGVALPSRFFYGEDTARAPKTLAISTDRKTLKEGFADLRGITSISTQAFSSTLISSIYFDDSITTLELNAFNTAQTLTLYTGAANNAAVASFAADNTYRTYFGGTSFIDASGSAVLEH